MPNIFAFHILISLEPHIIIDQCFNELYVMFMLNSNEPIKVAHLQKLANQPILNGALVIEMVYNSFNESKKNFGRLIRRGTF